MHSVDIVDAIPVDGSHHGTDYMIHEPNAIPAPVYRVTLDPLYQDKPDQTWLYRIPEGADYLSTIFAYDKRGTIDRKHTIRTTQLRLHLPNPSSFVVSGSDNKYLAHYISRYRGAYNVNYAILLGYDICHGRACIGYHTQDGDDSYIIDNVSPITNAIQIELLNSGLEIEYLEVLKAAKIFDVLCCFFNRSLGVSELRNIRIREINQLQTIAYAIARGKYPYGESIGVGIPQSFTNRSGKQRVKIKWLNLEFLGQAVDQM